MSSNIIVKATAGDVDFEIGEGVVVSVGIKDGGPRSETADASKDAITLVIHLPDDEDGEKRGIEIFAHKDPFYDGKVSITVRVDGDDAISPYAVG